MQLNSNTEVELLANNGRRLTAKERALILELRAQRIPLMKIAQRLDCALFTVQWHIDQDKKRQQRVTAER